MVVLIDTDDVEAADRGEVMRRAIAHATGPHDVRFVGEVADPHVRMEYWSLSRDVVLMREFSTGVAHLRDGRHDRLAAAERVAFVVHGGPAGSYSAGSHSDGGDDSVLCAGGLYVTDLSGHFSYRRAGPGEVRILQIERDALGLTAEQVRTAAAHVGRSPLYSLFRAQLIEALVAAELISTGPASEQVADSLSDIAAVLLRTTTGKELRSTDLLGERIDLYLRDNFRRPDLSPAYVAFAHHISERQLFKVWSARPFSVMETVYALRLDHASQVLAIRPKVTVSAVAVDSGFRDVSHFCRRFRAAFGLSPGEFRRRAQGQPTAAV